MRRTWTVRHGFVRALAIAAGVGVLAAAAPGAWAQGRGGGSGGAGGQPPAGKASVLDSVIMRGRERDWTLRVTVHLSSYQRVTSNAMPEIEVMELKTAAVVFPVNLASGSSELDVAKFKGELKFNDAVVDSQPKFLEGYPAGTRLGRWEMTEKSGREMQLDVELPVTSWSTIFDEKAAGAVAWPANWPTNAASALKPDAIVNSANPAVQELVKKWTGGNDPKKIPPVQLAKFLAGQVMEHVQTSGNGLASADNGLLMGVDLQPIEETAGSGRGSEHDMVVLLAAVYRAAGLPARTVIGHDMAGKKGGDSFLDKAKKGPQKLRAWVEFCLYDEGAQKEAWVPVDIVRMRASSNRVPPLNKPWKYFGTHDELENVIPFAFQYHPPTTVVAHGAYSFWGWLPTPEIPNVQQYLRFDAITTPKRAGDRRDRR